MILIIGSDDDPTINYFIRFLHQMREAFLFLNQRQIGKISEVGNDSFKIEKSHYYFKDFTGVLNRLAGADREKIKDAKHHNIISHLFGLLSYEFKNVFNRPYAGFSNDSKLYQLSLLNLKYIKIPQYKILSNHKISDHINNGGFIVKSLSSIRSEVVEYSPNENSYFKEKSSEPVLFQEKIEGYNIRVHVVVDKAFVTKITADTVDYRYSEEGANFTPYNLDKKILGECIRIANSLELRFAGIDLIRYKDSYYILEVNPSPGWSYFESKIDNKAISTKLLEELKKCY